LKAAVQLNQLNSHETNFST